MSSELSSERPAAAIVEEPVPPDQADRPPPGWLGRLARSSSLWTFGVLAGLVLFFSVASPSAFLSEFNFRNIVVNVSVLLVMAVGMTFVIVSAGIDLSVGSVLIFSGVAAAKTMAALGDRTAGWDAILVGVLVGLAAGLGWGLVNGLLVTAARIPPLIATLGTLGMALGLGNVLAGGSDITAPRALSRTIGRDLVLEAVPWLVIIAAVVAAVLGLVLALTRFGRHTYAVGSNPEAARRVGINVRRHQIKLYALCGTLAGLAGVLSLARFDTTTIGSHTTDNLSVIAGVVIGGGSLFGGVGTMAGTVMGILIPGVLENGLVIVGVQRFWLNFAVGAVLVVAVFLDQLRRRLRERE